MNKQSSLNSQKALALTTPENPEIIADKLNQSLNYLGIRAKVALKNAYLGILLEASQISDKEHILAIVRQQIDNYNFKSESIQAVRIYGREIGQLNPQWCEEIKLEKSAPSNYSILSLTDWLSQGIEAPKSSFEQPEASLDRDVQKFLRFHFSSDSTALLPLSTIKEVLNISIATIHPVPHVAECLLGIYDYRGEILWLVDLGQQLNLTPSINSLNFNSNSLNYSSSLYPFSPAVKGDMNSGLTDTLTVIAIQDGEKCLGLVVPKVVDIEMHDTQEMQPASSELFSPQILPFLQGYLIHSSTPVLNPRVLIEDSQLQLC